MIDQGNLIVLTPKMWQIPKIFVMGSDAAEFANKVKDQVRNILQKVAPHREELLLDGKCAFRKVRRDDSR